MIRITRCCFALLLSFSILHSQDWANKWFSEIMAGENVKPDSLVGLLKIEMRNVHGVNAPTISFRNLDADTMQTLADYKGQVLVVNFWATNCSGCRYEMPALSRLQEAYAGKGLRVVFLSSQNKEILLRYFKENKIVGVNGTVERNQLERPFQMVVMPSSFIVDRKGIVRDTWVGPETFDGAKKRILPLLEPKQ